MSNPTTTSPINPTVAEDEVGADLPTTNLPTTAATTTTKPPITPVTEDEAQPCLHTIMITKVTIKVTMIKVIAIPLDLEVGVEDVAEVVITIMKVVMVKDMKPVKGQNIIKESQDLDRLFNEVQLRR